MRKVLHKILLVVNIIFALALLFSYLAVIISPIKFTLPAFFGLAYPYLLLINIIFSVVWLMLLKYEALISIIIIILGLHHLTNYIKFTKSSESKAGNYTILSYNVRLFNYFENNTGTSSEKKVIAFIKAKNPDIICLQEFFFTGDPSVKEAYFIQALGGKYYSHMKVIVSGKNKSYGIITFSRFPIIRKSEIVHPGSSSLSIFSDIVIKKDTVRIYNNHLQSFRLKKMERSFIEEIMASGDKQVKSLSLSLKNGFIKRALQAQVLKERINKSPYPVIVAGDFNDTPVSYAYRKIRKGLNDSFVISGYGAGFTYRGNYPPNRIDYILYDNTFTSSYFDIFKVKYSDHYPIMAWFRKKN